MAESAEYPISVRLPGYVVKKIDELVRKKEFRSRSDFIKYAVILALSQIMVEEARELARSLTPEEIRREVEEARRRLLAGEFENEEEEVSGILEEVEEEYRKLKDARK